MATAWETAVLSSRETFRAMKFRGTTLGERTKVEVVAGTFQEDTGPIKDIVCEPQYLDVQLAPGKRLEHEVKNDHTLLAYVLEGRGRFLLISGKPIGEPVAWRGPIVMNTDDELPLGFLSCKLPVDCHIGFGVSVPGEIPHPFDAFYL